MGKIRVSPSLISADPANLEADVFSVKEAARISFTWTSWTGTSCRT